MDGDTGGRAPRAVPPALRVPRPHRWDAPVSRRGVVAAATLGAVTVLAGCGLRLDLPPDPAPTPTRRPAPDERYLLSVIADLRDLIGSERRLVASGAAGTVVPTLLPLHERQVTVLVGRLTNDGVPTTAIPTAGPTGAGAATTPAQLATRLAALTAADWTELAAASAGTRELVAAAYGTRLAGAELLGRAVAVPATPSPARTRAGGPHRPARLCVRGRRRPVDRQEPASAPSRPCRSCAGCSRTSPAWPEPRPTSPAAGRSPSRSRPPRRPPGWPPGRCPRRPPPLPTRPGSPPPAPPSRTSRGGAPGCSALATTWGVPLVAFPGTAA